jgi:hypothetical protein
MEPVTHQVIGCDSFAETKAQLIGIASLPMLTHRQLVGRTETRALQAPH